MNEFYVYVYLDPRCGGNYVYGNLQFPFEPFYVGKGKNNRATAHLREALGDWKPRQTKHYKYNKLQAILSEGLLPVIQKIREGLVEQDAYMLEEQIIRQIGCVDEKTGPLTNILKNNEFGPLSEEARERAIETRRKNGNYVMSPEQKEKIRQAHLGKKLTDEHKRHILEARKGYTHSEETKEKMRTSAVKVDHAEITKQAWLDPTIRARRLEGLKQSKANRKGIKSLWINNGITSGRYDEVNALLLLEQGWVRGRLSLKKKPTVLQTTQI